MYIYDKYNVTHSENNEDGHNSDLKIFTIALITMVSILLLNLECS